MDNTKPQGTTVAIGAYESAVKGRSDFREAYRGARQEAAQLREFVSWVDTWVSNPIGSYSYPALAGLFSQAKEKIALLALQGTPCPGCDGHECDDGCAYPGALSNGERP